MALGPLKVLLHGACWQPFGTLQAKVGRSLLRERLRFPSALVSTKEGTLCRTGHIAHTHNDKPDGGVLQPSLLLPACWGGGGSTAHRGSRGGGRFDGRNLRREEEEEQEEDVSRFLVLG